MYEALIQPEISVDNNKIIGKMKITLKIKILACSFVEEWSPQNSRSRVFCQQDETIKHHFSSAVLLDLYDQSSK
jgi:hypothetical protein